jgi:imidazolonepropionase
MNELDVIENGAVIVDGGTISWCGRMEDLTMSKLKESEVLDCIDSVVIPGFVDSHSHLLFAGYRDDEFAMRSAGMTYQEIATKGGGILKTVSGVRQASKKDLKKNARKWIDRLLAHGTTTVEVKSGYGLEMDSEIRMLEAITELNNEEVMTIVPTFLGAHAIPPEYSSDTIGDYVRDVTDRMIPYIGSKKLAAFCDVFCEQGYFDLEAARTILVQGKRFGLLPKIHAEELTALGGAELAADVGAISADHLEHVSDAGIRALAQSGVVATVLPGVSFFLNHPHAPVRKLIDAGVPVAIATDFNPGSCMSYDMPLMMTIACAQMQMTPEEAITASTLNGAAALNLSDTLGSIEVGKRADMVVLDIPSYTHLAYRFGEIHVSKVVKDGVVLEV